MPSLFKSTTVVYRDRKGKKCDKGDPGARKVRIVSKVWYGRYKDADGRRRTVPLCPDKTASKDMLAKLVTDAKTKQLYPEPPVSEAERKLRESAARPLLDHLEDFRRVLAAKGNTPDHVARICGRARAVLEGCGFVRPADLQAAPVVEFLAGLRADGDVPELPPGQETFTGAEVAALLGVKTETVGRRARRRLIRHGGQGRARTYPRAEVEALLRRRRRGLGVMTSNHYLVAVKALAKWLAKEGRIAANPLAHLERQNARVDVRRPRRAAAVEEFTRLTEAALRGAPFLGIAGQDRAFLYLLAADTGLRANELASLTPESFDLDADPPTVTVRAGYSKHRREDVQPLRPGVADLLRPYLAGKAAGSPVRPGTWSDNAAEMLRVDLEAAGVPYQDQQGRYFDFHGTRHTFISRLASGGVHPKLAQILARHSTITLTMDFYTHLGLHDQTAALAKLPPLPPLPPLTNGAGGPAAPAVPAEADRDPGQDTGRDAGAA
jgi:integrase